MKSLLKAVERREARMVGGWGFSKDGLPMYQLMRTKTRWYIRQRMVDGSWYVSISGKIRNGYANGGRLDIHAESQLADSMMAYVNDQLTLDEETT